ncbi:TadE/TadG family type IV pilus assembly protein [Sphingomonas floccifaciens]|uniref:TadE/TadG family type IV pilus assembly protein n=1 Tax=Sphingomonas floccifaciens TaxID=1844115 RepID=A0ABW4NCG8_9SPHN
MRAVTFLRRLATANQGLALVEFAMVLPFMALLYVGSYQICDAVAAYRKVTRATRTIADLTSQYTSVDEQDVTEILDSSIQVMSPYATTAAKLVVTQVTMDANKNPTVDWSRGKNTTGLIKGSVYNLPTAIRQANTSVIVATVTYTYKPAFGAAFVGTLPLSETIIMSPRASASVALQP